MTTQGDEKHNRNNHPFEGKARTMPFALAHNGVIYNDKILRKAKALPDTTVETDSYIAVQLLEQLGELTFDSLRVVAESLQGSFTLTVLSPLGLDIVRGNNPLCLYHFPDIGVYVYASTFEILCDALGSLPIARELCIEVPTKQGELLHIAPNGTLTRSQFDDTALRYGYVIADSRYYDVDNMDDPEMDEYLAMLIEYAQTAGVSGTELDLLIGAGYDVWELEEMIYDEHLRKVCVDSIIHADKKGALQDVY
jgi:hypothetical protein